MCSLSLCSTVPPKMTIAYLVTKLCAFNEASLRAHNLMLQFSNKMQCNAICNTVSIRYIYIYIYIYRFRQCKVLKCHPQRRYSSCYTLHNYMRDNLVEYFVLVLSYPELPSQMVEG